MPGPELPNKPNQIHLPLLTPTDLPPQEAATATCQLLTAVVGQLPLAVAVLEGSDYRIKLANPAMYEIWQLPPGDKLGEPVFDAFPLIANQGLDELLDQVRRTGLAARGEELPSEFIRDGKQTTVYIDFVYSPLANQTSQLPDILVSATDVTERVLARRVLEETTQQLRGLVESAPFPIAVYSGREMRIELANQAIIDVYGKGPDVIGKCYPELLPELASQGIFEQLQSVYNTGVPFSSGTSRVDIDHQGELIPYYFNYNFTPLFDAAGRVYGVMNTGADVTPLDLARQQVEQTATALQNAIELAELGNFSVDIATNLLTVSPRVATWFGFDSLAHDAETFIMGVGERERDYVRTSLYNTLLPESDGRYDVIHSVVNAKTGRSVILHALGQVYFNAVGEPLRIEGTA
ncbi:PAS domain-containing protein [Spirosoma sp. RP8]|uniref:PAS domain-containing protein n=1 Tax=Spirosoma liriopis TaxID=2937440 RepID=A0ABT0HUC4_9BACT|nr:PAS domain-containing protein [Spirosoma liriopis]MCK8495813.1 PAS domain-containing protein [Spirosoma liriopis]